MREQEMRQRVFRFLKARMRNMIMPATVGIGLAVGGCTTSTSATPVYSAPIQEDASLGQDVRANADSPVPRQDAQADADTRGADGPAPDLAVADVARDAVLPGDVPIYGSDVSLLDLRDAEAADGGAVDLGQSGAVDSATDTMLAKYMAPIFDAGADGTPVLRYMAQQPDGSSVVTPMYMAPTTPIAG